FVAIEKIPLTTNGKLDARALPAPDREAFAGAELVAPRNPAEERMAAVWKDVLGLDEIGVEDSFFDVGGDSIRAVRLVSALREAGFDLAVADVFLLRTVARLAEAAGEPAAEVERFRTVERFALVGAEDRAKLPAGVVDAYPLSQVQTGMIVELLSSAEAGTYQNISSFRIRDERPFDAEALRAAVAAVVGRHEILRTSVDLTGYSLPMQLVHGEAEMKVAVEDLRGLDEAARFQALLAFAERERAELFDLASAPLMRVTALLEADDAWRIAFTHCHAVTDGWSINTLLGELVTAYRSLRDGGPAEAADLPEARYADFVAAELAALAGGEDEAFWLDVVGSHVPFALPEGWGERDTDGEDFAVQVAVADLEPGLRALARQAGVSLKSVVHAAYVKTLSMLTLEPAFFTGLVAHGRPAVPGSEQVLGMHLNTLPFPVVRGARTWRELVEQVFARETEIWAHRHFPLPAVQRAAGSKQRLLNAVFDFHDFHQVDTELVDTGATLGQGSTEFDLHVIASGTVVHLKTSTAVVTRAEADRLAAVYRSVLEAMAADPDGDARLAYLPAEELELLVGAWASAVETTVEQTVHEVFERQVAATPDAVAVVFDGVELTYAEVNER
ncbi:condensation domain-containing protein, partial [Kitasatospora sp. NPDC054939]